MFINCLLVGAGGALGAICRYLLSLIKIGCAFPVMTFITNIIGTILVGFITAAAVKYMGLSPGTVLFLKTGFCGGFTTFSTFSLEMLGLLQNRQLAAASAYMIFSIFMCVSCVWLGGQLAEKLI